MPHMVLDEQIPHMIDAVHHAAFSTGLFVETHIRTRAIPVSFYRTGTGYEPFIHAQLRIHSGRDEKQKKDLSRTVLNAILQQGWPASVVTVEVVDMDIDSYSRHSA